MLTVTSDGGADAFQFTGTDVEIRADGGIAFVAGSGTDDGIRIADDKDLTLRTVNSDVTVTSVTSVAGDDDQTLRLLQELEQQLLSCWY